MITHYFVFVNKIFGLRGGEPQIIQISQIEEEEAYAKNAK